MYKKFLWIAALGFSLILSQTVLADGCGEGLKTMLQTLKLDDAQKTKIQPIMDQLRASIKENGTQMNDLDNQIRQQVMSPTMDQSTVNGLVDKKAQMIGNMMKAKITAKNQILTILTPEQKMQLQSKMQKMEERMAAKFKSCHDDD